LIVDNYPPSQRLLLRDQMRDLNADAQKIADGLHIPVQEVIDKVRRYQLARKPAFEPIIIKDDITPDERAFIESHRDEFPELETLMIHRRLYPKDGFMAHLIATWEKVSEDMLNSPKFELYERGDICGQSGVELQYNDLLMARRSRRVLVNSKGKEVGRPPNANIPAVPGQKLKLTVDLDIQRQPSRPWKARTERWSQWTAQRRDPGHVSRPALIPMISPCASLARMAPFWWKTRITRCLTKQFRRSWRRLSFQDHNVRGRTARRHRAKYAGELRGWSGFLRTLFQLLGKRRAPCPRHYRYFERDLPIMRCLFYTLAERLGLRRSQNGPPRWD